MAAQPSLHPTKYAGVVMEGVAAFLSIFLGLKLAPTKQRYLILPTSPHQGATQYP